MGVLTHDVSRRPAIRGCDPLAKRALVRSEAAAVKTTIFQKKWGNPNKNKNLGGIHNPKVIKMRNLSAE